MRNKLNVIQINGFRGILFLIGAAICLFAGFVVFPGIVMKMAWNFVAGMTGVIPTIAVLQGVLLWAITVVAYFAFKKKGFFVEFKSTNDLSRDEMDAVMQRIRMERQSDLIAKSILRAKELEAEMQKEIQKNLNNENNINKEETEQVHNQEKIS